MHILLPGHGNSGPTLEIFEYPHSETTPVAVANREGFSHVAFEVDDIEEALAEVRNHGGGAVGDVTTHEIEGVGLLSFVYATDPEGNIVELQSWK